MSRLGISKYVLLATLGFSVAGYAEEATESYQAVYFDKYSPQTALDMVQKVPGFRLDLDKDDIRGFGATAGNVLIDGKRPSSKSAGIEEALKRIPASKVDKVEVIRGNSSLSQTSGQSVIVNVILQQSLTASRITAGLKKHSKSNKLSPSIEFNSSAVIDGWNSSIKIDLLQKNYGRETEGIREAQTDSQALDEQQKIQLTDAFLSADSSKKFSLGALSLTGQLGSSKYVPITERQIYSDRLRSNLDSNFYNLRISEFFTGEFGVDWEQSFSDSWTWKMIGLFNWQNWWVDAGNRLNSADGNFVSANKYRFDESKDEKVFRTIFTNQVSDNFSFDFGGELTFNRLDSALSLYSLLPNDDLDELLQSNFTYVTEDRSELFFNTNFNFDPVILRLGMNYEQSSISVDGEVNGGDDLSYLKPFLGLTYNISKQSQLRLNYQKEIGQLDFSDFAASIDLVNDRGFSSTAQLRPDQKKALVLSYDHQFGAESVLSLSTFYEKRSDVLEQVLLPSNQQTLGNAGDATVIGGELTYATSLDYIGLANSRLDFEINVSKSEFKDPITQQKRELTASQSPRVKIGYRHDLGQSAWGLEYYNRITTDYYYVAEYEELYKKDSGRLFVEWSPWSGSLLSLELTNVGVSSQQRTRYFYYPDRSKGLVSTHRFNDDNGIYVSLNYSYSF